MVFRIGLVGAGRMGLTHLGAIRGESRVAITAIAEPRDDVARRLTNEGLNVVSTVDHLINLSSLDGFLVSTPSGTHVSVVEQLATTGKPILCEKPAGLSVADAESIKSACETSGSRLQIGYWRRFIPALRAIRRKVAAGEYGRVLLLEANQWDETPPEPQFRNASGGIATDMGVHEIDIVRWISGHEVIGVRQRNVMSTVDGIVDEDAATLQLDMSDGSLAVATLGRFYQGGDFVGFEILGERRHTRAAVLTPRTGTKPQLDALRMQARAFSRGVDPNAATIDDAIAVLRVLEHNRKVA